MKNKIIKLIALLGLLLISGIFFVSSNASDTEAKYVVDNFMTYIEHGNSKAKDYIDDDNYILYNTVQEKLYSISSLDYQITKITQEDNIYHISAKISAEGDNWKISGITVNFDVKRINNSYKITYTDFFEKANSKYGVGIVATVFSVIGIVFLIIMGVLITIGIIIVIIVVLVVKSNKKKKE